ncbi:hypothetical protein H4Q26_015100 [Puccinia striiformis f. sp. tritici PST-130]|nr:hypothetical protein H4Q26_015100 [Puccinia striiformis f. sp. tritici PST-130]
MTWALRPTFGGEVNLGKPGRKKSRLQGFQPNINFTSLMPRNGNFTRPKKKGNPSQKTLFVEDKW